MDAIDIQAVQSEHAFIYDCVHRLYRDSLFHPVNDGSLDLLKSLRDRLSSHFGTERTLMERSAYPDRASHGECHDMILRLIDKLVTTLSHHDYTAFRTEMPYLAHIILDHTCRDDRRLDDHLEHAAAAAAA